MDWCIQPKIGAGKRPLTHMMLALPPSPQTHWSGSESSPSLEDMNKVAIVNDFSSLPPVSDLSPRILK